MKTKKPLARTAAFFLAALLTATLLVGCGGTSGSNNTAAAYPAEPPYATAEQGAMAATEDAAYNTGGDGAGPALTMLQDDRKITLTAYLTLESTAFEETCAKLQKTATELGGYVSATDMYGGDSSLNRSASFTIKIPAEQYGQFLEAAAQAGNLVSRSEQTEDVTDYYVDVEARLKSLRTQEARLLEMMGETGQLADLILIQEQLANVQYEIESYVAQQRNLDSRISYSTVNITVQEVTQITEVQDTYWSRITAAFRESWRAAGRGIQEFGLIVIWLLPLLLAAIVVLLVVLFLRRRLRKKRAEHPPAPKNYPSYAVPGQPFGMGQPYPGGGPYSPYAPYPVPRIDPAPPPGVPTAGEVPPPDADSSPLPCKEPGGNDTDKHHE